MGQPTNPDGTGGDPADAVKQKGKRGKKKGGDTTAAENGEMTALAMNHEQSLEASRA